MTRRPSSAAHDSAPAYIFALSTVALAFVLYLGWASYFVLKVFCVLCAITYVSVVAIFVISGGATALPMTKLPSRALRDVRTMVATPVALLTAVLFAAAAVGVVAAFPREGLAQAAAQTQEVQLRLSPMPSGRSLPSGGTCSPRSTCRSPTTGPRCWW